MAILLTSAAAAAQQQPTTARASGTPSSAPAIDYNTAHAERRLTTVRSTGPITLDGALDEPAWATAPIATHFIQNDPREGQPATYDTEVRTLYDDDAIYFGVYARDDEPRRIIIND